jgi:hypothetical protein
MGAPPLTANAYRRPTGPLGRAGERLLDAPIGLVLIGLVALAILKDGISRSLNLPYWLQMARAFPASPHLVPKARYMLSSPIGPAVAHILGLESGGDYATVHLMVVALGLGLLVTGLLRRGGRRAAVLGAVLFVASPLSDVLLSWLGMQDAWLFTAICVLVLFERPAALGVAAAIAGLAQPEMACIAVVTMAALRWLDRRDGTVQQQVTTMAVGLALGCVGTVAYEFSGSGGVLGDASFISIIGLGTIAADFLRVSPAWLWSTFAGAWAWVVAAVRWAKPGPPLLVSMMVLIVATAMSVITLDETRVFALLSFPLVLWWTVRSVEFVPPVRLQAAAAVTLVLAVAVPNVVAIGGRITG